MDKPEIVSAEQWQLARDELLKDEKEATRMLDAIAARRRRLPMVKFTNEYAFDTPTGTKTLLDLFEGRNQLVVYQFMDNGPDDYCPGCTNFTNNVPVTGLAGLADYGVSWVTVSNMPLAQIEAYKARMGWTLPFVSSRGTSFADDCGAGRGFMLSVFLRDGDDVYRTYSTTARGVDRLVFTHSLLDLTPYGRQEDWEDSPPGWPQRPTYGQARQPAPVRRFVAFDLYHTLVPGGDDERDRVVAEMARIVGVEPASLVQAYHASQRQRLVEWDVTLTIRILAGRLGSSPSDVEVARAVALRHDLASRLLGAAAPTTLDVLDRLRAAPEECVYVGDGEDDELAGAATLGMRVIRTTEHSDTDPSWAGDTVASDEREALVTAPGTPQSRMVKAWFGPCRPARDVNARTNTATSARDATHPHARAARRSTFSASESSLHPRDQLEAITEPVPKPLTRPRAATPKE